MPTTDPSGRPEFDTPAGAEHGQEHRTAVEALADEQPLTGAPGLVQTPSQTVGPFFGYALPFPGGAESCLRCIRMRCACTASCSTPPATRSPMRC